MGDPHQPPRPLGQIAPGSPRQQPQGAGDRGQGCSQFVAHGRDEFGLHLLDAPTLAHVANGGDHIGAAGEIKASERDFRREGRAIPPPRQKLAGQALTQVVSVA